MTLQTATFSDPQAFLRWNEGRDGKRELFHGVVEEMMVGSTVVHNRRIAKLDRLLSRDLPPGRYDVATQGLAVTTPHGVRYPDLVVYPFARGNDAKLEAIDPVLIAEVLSPSSLARDFVVKREEYQALPSLAHYLVASAEEARLWLFSRDADGQWSGLDEAEGADAVLSLGALGLSLALGEIYGDLV